MLISDPKKSMVVLIVSILILGLGTVSYSFNELGTPTISVSINIFEKGGREQVYAITNN